MSTVAPSSTRSASRLLALALSIPALSGCATMVAYTPRAGGELQQVRYAQGVGTLSVKDAQAELFMYPTFKTQGTDQPTFTLGFANNSGTPVEFSTDNVKAFFRGAPVALYTYNEKVAEIENVKRGQQVALALLGGLAAGAAAYNASHRTYNSNYSGTVFGRGGSASFYGSNTIRVYDPMSGMLAGAAFGGATALGVRQVEFNAQSAIESAGAILQRNTVEPLTMVSGNLVIKDCCDPFPKDRDLLRFEVSTPGKVHVFEFARDKISK